MQAQLKMLKRSIIAYYKTQTYTIFFTILVLLKIHLNKQRYRRFLICFLMLFEKKKIISNGGFWQRVAETILMLVNLDGKSPCFGKSGTEEEPHHIWSSLFHKNTERRGWSHSLQDSLHNYIHLFLLFFFFSPISFLYVLDNLPVLIYFYSDENSNSGHMLLSHPRQLLVPFLLFTSTKTKNCNTICFSSNNNNNDKYYFQQPDHCSLAL